MLDNIKSSYILQELFSLVDEEIKLKLLKYTKKLKNKLNITLNNYKLLYGSYIIMKKMEKLKNFLVLIII